MIHASSSPTRWFDALEKLRCVCTITSTVQVQYNNTSSRSCHSLPIWLIITCNLYHTLTYRLAWAECYATSLNIQRYSLFTLFPVSTLRVSCQKHQKHQLLCYEYDYCDLGLMNQCCVLNVSRPNLCPLVFVTKSDITFPTLKVLDRYNQFESVNCLLC